MYSGAITLLQKELEKPVIWVVCRWHVMEVHVNHAMGAVFGPTTAPYDPLFKHLQDNWKKAGVYIVHLKHFSLHLFFPANKMWHIYEILRPFTISSLIFSPKSQFFPKWPFPTTIAFCMIYNI